jgi:hypothetical protein
MVSPKTHTPKPDRSPKPVANVSTTIVEKVLEATMVKEAMTAHVPTYTNTDRSPYVRPARRRRTSSTEKMSEYDRNCWCVGLPTQSGVEERARAHVA